MASIYKESKSSNNSSNTASLDLLEDIRKLVETERKKTQLSYDEFLLFLKRWWCSYYKRPYKDPLLDTYTFEELCFEYYDVNHTDEKPEDPAVDTGNIPKEEYDWAAEEDAKEQADREEIIEAKMAIIRDDTIVDESIGLPDDVWANQYEPNEAKINPNVDAIDDGGDIFTNFES